MQLRILLPLFLAVILAFPLGLSAQFTDTIVQSKKPAPSPHSPKKAIVLSAIIPGWGQAYNKKYWKIPIIYAGLGTTTYLFFRNKKQYEESKDAYILASDTIESNDWMIKEPYYSVKDKPERIRSFRDQVRQNMDYCVLWFIIIWGINVADAAVDAHLKSFDVGDNLSLRINPSYSPMANTGGISLILNWNR